MILIRIMSFVHSSGIFDLDFWLQQDSPSALRNTMNSPAECSPGWIEPQAQGDPRISTKGHFCLNFALLHRFESIPVNRPSTHQRKEAFFSRVWALLNGIAVWI